MKNKFTKFLDFFADVGFVAWMCLLLGIVLAWSGNKIHIILGLIALLYGWGRIQLVYDKYEILREIRRVRNKK